MSRFRKSYLEELGRIHERVRSLFEEMLLQAGLNDESAGGPEVPPGSWSPAVDILETGDAFLLDAEVPGVGRGDVDLTVDGRWLQLTGRRRPLPADRVFARMERSYGPFRRSFELPEAVDANGIEASLDGGVLRVRLPKRSAAAARPTRSVPIADEGSEPEGGG